MKTNIIPENVWEFLHKASDDYAKIKAEKFTRERHSDIIEQPITSPIEQLFLIAMHVMCEANFDLVNPEPEVTRAGLPILRGGVFIYPQRKIDRYTVDFLIQNIGFTDTPAVRTVVVELDGHDFHDKDKQQRSYEKARDRFLLKRDFKVLHFTGSDVVADPYAVAHEVLDALEAYGAIGSDPYNKKNPFGLFCA